MERLDCDRMFVAVMEAGSFAKAAERLDTSSGQASKLVSRLERELGVRLLNRTTRAIAPTEVGQAYFERIKPLLDEIDALDEAIKTQSGAVSGRLRLTVPMTFGIVQLVPAFIAFAEAYPAVDLDVSFTDRVVNLVDEGFDAGVRVGAPADSGLIARKLCNARIVVAASPDFAASHGLPAKPAELAGCNAILDTNVRDPQIWRFRDPASDQAIAIQVSGRLRFSNADACVAAADHGLGIARVPSFIAGPLFQSKRLVPLLQDFEPAPFGVFAIYPPGRHLARKVRALVDFLVERFRGEPAWDKGW